MSGSLAALHAAPSGAPCRAVAVETAGPVVRPVPRLFLPGILEPDTYRNSAADGDCWAM